MKKYLFLVSIFFYTLTVSPVLADDYDSFNSGYGSWSSSGVQGETYICSGGCNSVKLSDTRSAGGGGYITRTFSAITGAKYQISVRAGVFNSGVGPDGEVWMMATSGSNNASTYCSQNSCSASGSSINGSLTISNFTAESSWITVKIEGVEGGCVDGGGCRDPYADNFSLVKTADAPTPPPATTTNASTCSSISINNGNPIIAGQTYTAAVNMRNDGNTTWSSGTNYNLGSQEPQDLTTWGTTSGTDSGKGTRPNRVTLPRSIGPGDTAPFTFSVTAPNTAGTYRFSYQMVQDGPAGWFGSRCTPNVNVSSPTFAELRVSCEPNPTTATTTPPQSITWTATAIGGSGSHNYTWAGDEGLSGAGTRTVINGTTPTTHSINKTYTNTGTKAGRVKVTSTDGQDTRFVDCSPSVTITEPFNYTISNSGNITVTQGSSRANTITLTKTAGNAQSVSLSSTSTLPSGATKTITPTSCSPDLTCYPSFTVYTTDTTPVGTYPITVTSTSSGLSSKTTNFNLIVNAPVTGGTPPTVNIRANNVEGPIDIAHNAAATLSWVTANNPTSCTGTGSWSGAKSFTSGTTHTQGTGSLTGPNSYTYTIGCENPAGSYSDSVVVNVAGPPGATPTPTPSPGATPTPTPVASNCPWIQTTGGDVHSNTKITAKCGP